MLVDRFCIVRRAGCQILSNNYGAGADALNIPNRTRYHTDDSIEVKYYDHPERFLDKMAFSSDRRCGMRNAAAA